ncbi:MAG: hypothetical protein K1X75_09410 [Leptospirales bacterium]|nr:hypothetical protein [Leptospirales bacterium]
MAVSKDQKNLFNEKVRGYRNFSEDVKKEAATLKAVARKNPRLDSYVQVRTAILSLQRSNTLVLMSRLSQEIQSIKNDSYLNEARKEIGARLGELCKLVGEDLDSGLTENSEKLEGISELSYPQRVRLVRGFRQAIENVRQAMGETSKWRWYFPDLQLKLVTLARNLMDYKKYERTRDPNDPDFEPLRDLMDFILEASQNAAQEYRSKYELSTKEVSDLAVIRKIFEMQKRIYTFTGQRDEVARVTTSLDSISEKIESIMAEKSGKKKKSP